MNELLSKRELTAILLAQGFISSQAGAVLAPGEKQKIIKKSIEIADDLLRELDNSSKNKEQHNV